MEALSSFSLMREVVSLSLAYLGDVVVASKAVLPEHGVGLLVILEHHQVSPGHVELDVTE